MAVEVRGMHLAAAYQPIWKMDEEGMDRYRRDLESQVAIRKNLRFVIEGDFNASMGMNAERPGVCGNLGLGRTNDAGRDLIEWCEQHELQHVNSYMRYKTRGTWGMQGGMN